MFCVDVKDTDIKLLVSEWSNAEQLLANQFALQDLLIPTPKLLGTVIARGLHCAPFDSHTGLQDPSVCRAPLLEGLCDTIIMA